MITKLVHGSRRSGSEWSRTFRCGVDELRELFVLGVLHGDDASAALKFVGLIARDRGVWLCVPATMARASAELELSEWRSLNQLLETYASRSVARSITQEQFAVELRRDPGATARLKELDIFSALFRWTSAYGVHEAESLERTENLGARVAWNATFAECLPLVTAGGVVFDRPIALIAEPKLGYVGHAQAFALNDLARRYAPLTDAIAFPYNDVLEAVDDVCAASDVVTIVSADLLLEARHASNRDHEQELIAILQEYAGCTQGLASSPGGWTFHGTFGFELVWEDMCRVALGGSSSRTLGLSNPAYRVDRRTLKTDSQRPDLVLETESGATIIDAKYYPGFPETVPGLEDVRKQFFYAWSSRSGSAALAFVFPTEGRDVRDLGKAFMQTVDGSADERFGVIHCVGLPWQPVSEAYLRGKSSPSLTREVNAITAADI